MCKAIASVIVCPFPSFHHWIRRETKEGPTVSMLFLKKKKSIMESYLLTVKSIYTMLSEKRSTEDEHR